MKYKQGTRYRNAVLGLPKEVFNKLRSGKAVDIPEELVKKYPKAFKEIKDGK